MTKGEMAVYVTRWLCGRRARARILGNGEMCARCEKGGPGTCARCWEEAALAAAAEVAKPRQEMPGKWATFVSAGLPHGGW